jgi:hypothetical protein
MMLRVASLLTKLHCIRPEPSRHEIVRARVGSVWAHLNSARVREGVSFVDRPVDRKSSAAIVVKAGCQQV